MPAVTNFTVAGSAPARSGYVRMNAGKQYFETGDGQALPLIGENVCWHGARGTYDYDDWFAAMQAAGENYARLWMCPWAFGVETDANSLNRYRLDRAWQLDYVLQLAEQRGIYLELCLDYHGMFAVEPDYWGGNNYWPKNPYCITNGGPCATPNAFFTNTTAKTIYPSGCATWWRDMATARICWPGNSSTRLTTSIRCSAPATWRRGTE